jgi:hypothetical protein
VDLDGPETWAFRKENDLTWFLLVHYNIILMTVGVMRILVLIKFVWTRSSFFVVKIGDPILSTLESTYVKVCPYVPALHTVGGKSVENPKIWESNYLSIFPEEGREKKCRKWWNSGYRRANQVTKGLTRPPVSARVSAHKIEVRSITREFFQIQFRVSSYKHVGRPTHDSQKREEDLEKLTNVFME